jgi:hypothetical protein
MAHVRSRANKRADRATGHCVMDLTESEHRKLDQLMDTILQAYADEEVSLLQARSAIVHVFTSLEIDNVAEVRSWLEPERVADWKSVCRDATGA